MKQSTNDDKVVTADGRLISYTDIVRIEEKEGVTLLFMVDNKVFESVLSIDFLEWEFGADKFTRIHANHLINHQYVHETHTVKSEWLSMKNGDKLPVDTKLVKQTQRRGMFYGLKKLFFKTK